MTNAAIKYKSSFNEGNKAEDEFISLRGDNFIRRATRSEDMTQHWDVMDRELGNIDVKAGKRRYRGGPVDYSIHWWEFKNVAGRIGWGSPNGIDRLIAFRMEDNFTLVDPAKVCGLLLEKCTEHFRGVWGLNTRPKRKDLAAMIPSSFLTEHAEHVVKVNS
jgi:hypothetical protein